MAIDPVMLAMHCQRAASQFPCRSQPVESRPGDWNVAEKDSSRTPSQKSVSEIGRNTVKYLLTKRMSTGGPPVGDA